MGLIELSWHRQSAEDVDIANVVEGIAQKAVAVGLPDVADLVARDEFAIGAGQTKRFDGILQAVTSQMPAGVVALDLLIGIDDVAAVDIGGGVWQ